MTKVELILPCQKASRKKIAGKRIFRRVLPARPRRFESLTLARYRISPCKGCITLVDLAQPPSVPDFRMNVSFKSNFGASVYWYGDSRELVGRVSSEIARWSQVDWRKSSLADLACQASVLPPCQIVVIELQSWLDRAPDRDEILTEISNELSATSKAGNYPVVVCLGNDLPIEQVVQWIKKGIYSYAELSNDPKKIASVLFEAREFAASLRAKYARFKTLEGMWNSITPDEMAVLNLIFEGVPNKTIAVRMGTSQRTIESRRQRLFTKLDSKSLPIVIQRVCEWKQLQREFGDSN